MKLDFTGQTTLGKCPKCAGKVFEGPESYVCENTQADAKKCLFKIGKVICQLPIDRAQAAKVLASGRSDLQTKFISRAGKPFSAYLVVKKKKVEFEFPDRDDV